MIRQTLTRRIKVDCVNCIIFNIQSIIYKVTRYNNIITNTRNYKYLNVINIAYLCALINQNNLPNRLARCPCTENLSFKSSNRGTRWEIYTEFFATNFPARFSLLRAEPRGY